jgi:hypothetical protein
MGRWCAQLVSTSGENFCLLQATRQTLNSKLVVMQEEHFFQCPYCWQEISMVLDLSVDRQTYVEDCEVCCRPIEISYTADEGELVSFEAIQLE